jgi:hypothetical protein
MTEALRILVDRIRERFPTLDVRTDQCEIVRLIAKGIVVGIRQQRDQFRADVISLGHEKDLDTTLIKTVMASDRDEFEAQLFKELLAITSV